MLNIEFESNGNLYAKRIECITVGYSEEQKCIYFIAKKKKAVIKRIVIIITSNFWGA